MIWLFMLKVPAFTASQPWEANAYPPAPIRRPAATIPLVQNAATIASADFVFMSPPQRSLCPTRDQADGLSAGLRQHKPNCGEGQRTAVKSLRPMTHPARGTRTRRPFVFVHVRGS
jgi:hypothetical protein